jgi:hypothetical protein
MSFMQHIQLQRGLKKMKSISLLLILTYSTLLSSAQVMETNPTENFANHWIFGKNVHLEISENKIYQHKINNIDWLEGSTSYSDTKGSLLYYKASSFIKDSNNNIISPQVGGGSDATQGSLFLRHLESEVYYYFASGRSGGSGYSTIESDTISIYLKRLPFLGGEKQQAINHQNGRDIWYANHARQGDSIYFFLIKKQGIIECPVVTHTGLEYTSDANGWSTQGQMKFSPDGRYLAEVSFTRPFGYGIYAMNTEYPTTDSLYIYEKGFTSIYKKNWPYGLEFSPDGTKVYVTAGRANDPQELDHPPVLYQLNLDSLKSDINQETWVSLDSLWNIQAGALQLAPNGKIYVAMPDQTYLGVINNPNELGAASNYVRQGLTLDSGGTSRYGLPTFNQSYFYTPTIDYTYEEDCFSNTYSFNGLDTFQGSSFEWQFRDIGNETVDVRLGKNISYSFPRADSLENKYEVTFIANSGSKKDSVTKILTIRPKLTTHFLGKDTFYCADAQRDFEISLKTPSNMHCVHWGMGVNGDVLEPYSNLIGDTVIGYENFYGHIHANTFRTIDTAGVYTARITNKAFCRTWDTIRVTEIPNPQKPSIQRNGQELESSITAAEYRWYYNGNLKLTTINSQLIPDSNGYWQVQLVSEYGCESQLSDSFNVGFASLKPLNPKPLSFKIYPNPSDGHISIEVPKEGQYNITLSTIGGQLVRLSDSPQGELYRSVNKRIEFELNLANGTYILTLTDEDGKTGSKKIEVVN